MPNNVGSTSSVEKLLPENSDSWETSFAMSHSKSTQPLLQDSEQHAVETVGPVSAPPPSQKTKLLYNY